MKKWNKSQIIENLKRQGLHFSNFSLVHEGEYATEDADWNYKDVPHLHHVHELVEAIFTLMDDEFITTINVQKVLGISLPLCVVNYQSGKNEQTYYTTWLFYTLIVHTGYEVMGPNRTRVITQYNIGCPWVLKWSVPLVRFLIKRNYKDLMKTDIPMRERRGQLRDWGYSFYKSTDSYSFPKTMEILNQNVVIPDHLATNQATIFIDEVLSTDGEYYHGSDNHLGLRLVRHDNRLSIYSRMCLHEGASLDASSCVDMKIKCPWHGRLHSPLATFDLAAPKAQQVKSESFVFDLLNKELIVTAIKNIPKRSCMHAEVEKELI